MQMSVSDTSRNSVWQSLRTLVPSNYGTLGTSRVRGGTAFKPTGDGNRRVEVQAKAATVEAPVLERSSATEGSQQQQQSSPAPQPDAAPEFGYARGWSSKYKAVKELGRGGNGIVTLVLDLQNGQEYATKSMPKVLTDGTVSDRKKAEHVDAIKREVEVLRRLRGCLNVASLEEVYEDDTHVHLVMEACRGGELHHAVGDRHFSERTVASYMRAVLKTLAQCHSHKILHRDIKPGNFLLSSEDRYAPLKAIDFGLAVFFDDKQLPRTDLGLEGTPWFMSPEALQSQVYPASDLWSAGVLAHQLLTGKFPFDDRASPFNPSLARIWRSILTDKVDFKRSHWEGISEEAKDFVRQLLDKDPKARPTARQALKHPWLQGPGVAERMHGKPLSLAVVQRIQRYSQGSALKRTVLEMIAEELLAVEAPEQEHAVSIDRVARPIITSAQASPLEYLFQQMQIEGGVHTVSREEVAEGLAKLGYRLSPEELDRLLDQLDTANTGTVARSQLVASQIDWAVLQSNQAERWLSLARSAFAELDTDGDGHLSMEEIVASLRTKLPPAEVECAVRHALQEASRSGEGSHHSSSQHGGSNGSGGGSSQHGGSLRNGLNFRQFVRMLRAGSCDSLDLYDDRLGGSYGSYGSLGSLSMLDKSTHNGSHYASNLQTVVEGEKW